jgi:two-component system chemotaxis response regulator CheB
MTASSKAAPRDAEGRYRVMVVDDSAVIRGFFRRALESDPTIDVVASVGNGQSAVDSLRRAGVDVIVLDIDMPVMDGMTALPQLLAIDPSARIIMASTLTAANAEISLRALSRGAADYIPKPSTAAEMHSAESFQRELVEKVKALGRARRGIKEDPAVAPRERRPSALYPAAPKPVVLRKPSLVPPAVLAIGSSTGGPQALMKVIQGLGVEFGLPILITQHMPATFTGILAEHIAKVAGRSAREAADGQAVEPGRIYVAPGDFHMTIEAGAAAPVIRLNQQPPVNFCRPSVDPMLASMARVYGQRLLALILTGMGHDGLGGGRATVAAGGTVVAQDEATSVVWGMPGAVATDGLCSAVLPLDAIAAHLRKLAGRPAP